MKQDYMNKFILEIRIGRCIKDIDSYIATTLNYLLCKDSCIDKNELIEDLNDARFILQILDKYIEELEEEYESDITKNTN